MTDTACALCFEIRSARRLCKMVRTFAVKVQDAQHWLALEKSAVGQDQVVLKAHMVEHDQIVARADVKALSEWATRGPTLTESAMVQSAAAIVRREKQVAKMRDDLESLKVEHDAAWKRVNACVRAAKIYQVQQAAKVAKAAEVEARDMEIVANCLDDSGLFPVRF